MARVEVKLVEKEVVRVDDRDVIGHGRCAWKIIRVERDQDRRVAPDGRS